MFAAAYDNGIGLALGILLVALAVVALVATERF